MIIKVQIQNMETFNKDECIYMNTAIDDDILNTKLSKTLLPKILIQIKKNIKDAFWKLITKASIKSWL